MSYLGEKPESYDKLVASLLKYNKKKESVRDIRARRRVALKARDPIVKYFKTQAKNTRSLLADVKNGLMDRNSGESQSSSKPKARPSNKSRSSSGSKLLDSGNSGLLSSGTGGLLASGDSGLLASGKGSFLTHGKSSFLSPGSNGLLVKSKKPNKHQIYKIPEGTIDMMDDLVPGAPPLPSAAPVAVPGAPPVPPPRHHRPPPGAGGAPPPPGAGGPPPSGAPGAASGAVVTGDPDLDILNKIEEQTKDLSSQYHAASANSAEAQAIIDQFEKLLVQKVALEVKIAGKIAQDAAKEDGLSAKKIRQAIKKAKVKADIEARAKATKEAKVFLGITSSSSSDDEEEETKVDDDDEKADDGKSAEIIAQEQAVMNALVAYDYLFNSDVTNIDKKSMSRAGYVIVKDGIVVQIIGPGNDSKKQVTYIAKSKMPTKTGKVNQIYIIPAKKGQTGTIGVVRVLFKTGAQIPPISGGSMILKSPAKATKATNVADKSNLPGVSGRKMPPKKSKKIQIKA